jgi:hypothetical protein
LNEDVQNERACSTYVGRNKITAEFWLGIMKETDSWEEIDTAGKTLFDIVKLHLVEGGCL